jgi:hypothetical protein
MGTAQGEADPCQGLDDFYGVLVVGAVDHVHVVVERFKHPPGLGETPLGQLQESDGAPQFDRLVAGVARLVAGVAVHRPHLAQDSLELLQGDRHLAQFGATVRGLGATGARLFAGGPSGAGEGAGERVELGQGPAVVAAEEANRGPFHAQVEHLSVIGAERQGGRLDNLDEALDGLGEPFLFGRDLGGGLG